MTAQLVGMSIAKCRFNPLSPIFGRKRLQAFSPNTLSAAFPERHCNTRNWAPAAALFRRRSERRQPSYVQFSSQPSHWVNASAATGTDSRMIEGQIRSCPHRYGKPE